MRKFKVGDLVRIRDTPFTRGFEGSLGVIIASETHGRIVPYYDVRLFESPTMPVGLFKDELEKVDG